VRPSPLELVEPTPDQMQSYEEIFAGRGRFDLCVI
jgi:hypothetical protein